MRFLDISGHPGGEVDTSGWMDEAGGDAAWSKGLSQIAAPYSSTVE